jgi:hypothetical protein
MRYTFLALSLAAILAGCSKSGPVKTTVSGAVTYNSEPVEVGIIRFIPTGGTEGPLATATIADGRYTATAAGGVPVGKHKVEILGYVELPRAANLPPMAPTAREQYIPDEFNKSSKLEFTIDSAGEVSKDFALEGPPRKNKPGAKGDSKTDKE